MPQPTTLGAEFLTYVLWTITPDGTTTNLGEIPIDKKGNGKLNVTAQSQTFAMIVTAEPYFAVQLPSEVVVLENDTKKNTKGKIFPDNDYKLMKRSQYCQAGESAGADSGPEERAPGHVRGAQCRGHREIAKGRAIRAGNLHQGDEAAFRWQRSSLASKADKSQIITNARQTIQFAEDARSLSAQRQEAERIQKEKDAAAAAAAAKAKAEADAAAAAEAKRQAELTAAKEAQMRAEAAAQSAQQKAEAEAKAAQQKAEADAAAQQAAVEQAALQAKEQAAREEAARAQAATAALRAQLLSSSTTFCRPPTRRADSS